MLNLPDTRVQIQAMAALASFGSKAVEAEPLLINRLNSTNASVAAMAAVALARMGTKPGTVVRVITRNLQATKSTFGYPAPSIQLNLWALGEFGPGAEIALPVISTFVSDPGPRTREIAEGALEKINSAHKKTETASP